MKKHKKNQFPKLVKLMETLRSPSGCPWDKEQTHKSLRPYLVEETCEVLEAIDKRKPKLLMDELGDLLYQVIFHAQIANERNRFDINDVIENAHAKLTKRHPHVFGNKKIKSSKKVVQHWHKSKLQEARRQGKKSAVANITLTLPALQKAGKVQRKVALVGFEWKYIHEVLGKVEEELSEVKQAIKKNKPRAIAEEIGDLLFAVANLSRFLGIEPEHALHDTVKKFTIRFRKLEKELTRRGKDIEKCSLSEMEKIWNKLKQTKTT